MTSDPLMSDEARFLQWQVSGSTLPDVIPHNGSLICQAKTACLWTVLGQSETSRPYQACPVLRGLNVVTPCHGQDWWFQVHFWQQDSRLQSSGQEQEGRMGPGLQAGAATEQAAEGQAVCT